LGGQLERGTRAEARFPGSAASPAPRAHPLLGVDSVLEGSVRHAGDRVHFTAQLVSAGDGFHLWAERYDRTLQDPFGVQEEIAHSIAEALRVTPTPSESKQQPAPSGTPGAPRRSTRRKRSGCRGSPSC
jgi:hypothetical protein